MAYSTPKLLIHGKLHRLLLYSTSLKSRKYRSSWLHDSNLIEPNINTNHVHQQSSSGALPPSGLESFIAERWDRLLARLAM